jgi:spermidine synthase
MSFSFFPKKLFKTSSSFNKKIEVIEQFGKLSLSVDNLTQSGGIVSLIWKKPISGLKDKKIENVLILGFGGGTVLKLLFRKNPQIKITGIEIDKKIISIAKEFFKIKEGENLEIINKDALLFLKETKKIYDLVLVDLYNGVKKPDFFQTQDFLKLIKKRTTNKGVVIFNWLKNSSSFDFEFLLKENFRKIKKINLRTNLFFIASD